MNFVTLSKVIIIELFLLFVQFGFGMWNNLFALIPLKAPFSFFVYLGGLEVLAHITDGALILALGFPIIWFSLKTKKFTCPQAVRSCSCIHNKRYSERNTFLKNILNSRSLKH